MASCEPNQSIPPGVRLLIPVSRYRYSAMLCTEPAILGLRFHNSNCSLQLEEEQEGERLCHGTREAIHPPRILEAVDVEFGQVLGEHGTLASEADEEALFGFDGHARFDGVAGPGGIRGFTVPGRMGRTPCRESAMLAVT